MNEASHPCFLFEFPDLDGKLRPKWFANPIEMIIAAEAGEVVPALKKVQQWVDSGFYAAGYLSYEAAPAFDDHFLVHSDTKMPLLTFGIFREPCENPPVHGPGINLQRLKWETFTEPAAYESNIAKVKEAIENGETYQLNYTVRMRTAFQADDLSLYHRLSENQPGYNAYLNLGRFRVLSASPELFFRWDGSHITTRPMKGTAARGRWFEEDRTQASWLFNSEKNRAENVMIVDLLRSDLGSIAETDSVKVSGLFDVEQYPTVWQMTSTIEAVTKPDTGLVDIFRALFPCGSVTGAPKVNTMKLIHGLEESPREVYCGAIGFIEPNGEAVFNVPIRTVVVDSEERNAEYGVGGGITWDSTPAGEYSEVLAKAEVLTKTEPPFELLESVKLRDGKYELLERHLQRLAKSAEFFHYEIETENINQKLTAFAQGHPRGIFKVRLLMSRQGTITVQGLPIKPLSGVYPIVLAKSPVSKSNVFLYHKTTNREHYHFHRAENPEAFDVLLWNEEEELTEFTNGNLVMELNGELWTPPRESGLLNGTFRDELLSDGRLKERLLRKEELANGTRLWLINSVRGWVSVEAVSLI